MQIAAERHQPEHYGRCNQKSWRDQRQKGLLTDAPQFGIGNFLDGDKESQDGVQQFGIGTAGQIREGRQVG